MTWTTEYRVVSYYNGETDTSETFTNEEQAFVRAVEAKRLLPDHRTVTVEQRNVIDNIPRRWEPYRV